MHELIAGLQDEAAQGAAAQCVQGLARAAEHASRIMASVQRLLCSAQASSAGEQVLDSSSAPSPDVQDLDASACGQAASPVLNSSAAGCSSTPTPPSASPDSTPQPPSSTSASSKSGAAGGDVAASCSSECSDGSAEVAGSVLQLQESLARIIEGAAVLAEALAGCSTLQAGAVPPSRGVLHKVPSRKDSAV